MRAFSISILVLSTLLPAQQSFTSPLGLLASEGNASVQFTVPFASANARFQHTDGGLRGTPLPGLNRLELRRDGVVPGTCPSRTAQIALVMAHCDASALTTNFANNYAGAPTTVFTRKAVSLPDHTTAPASPPAPWTVAFPFDVSWSYDGLQDLLWEVQLDTNSNPSFGYSLDCIDATSVGVGTFAYNGLHSCMTQQGKFDYYALAPATNASGATTVASYALRGPINSSGAWFFGLSDPNLAGVLCAPIRTSAELSIPCTTSGAGAIGSLASPLAVSFPYPGAATLYLQFAAVDFFQSPVPVALSDAAKVTLSPWQTWSVSTLYNLTGATAATGTRSASVYPVVRFTRP